jgi:hypothetical protein
MNTVAATASGGLSGALVVLILAVLKHYGIEVGPDVSTAGLVVINSIMHAGFSRHLTASTAKVVAATAVKQAQEDVRAKIAGTLAAVK